MRSGHRRFSFTGSYLLEFSAVLPVIFLLVFGAIDINTMLQGYTALQQGVKTALRCVYPTDGQCSQVQTNSRESLYNVIRHERDFHYFGSVFDYRGEASWFSLPILEYSGAQATVIDHVSYNAPQARYIAIWQEPSEGIVQAGEISYLLQTFTLPYLSGNALDPNFGMANSLGNRTNYPASVSKSISISNISGSTNKKFAPDEGILIGVSPQMAIPSPQADLPCFVSSDIDTAITDKNPNFAIPCTENKQASILFSVSGRVGSAQNRAQGKVSMKLLIADRPAFKLGGRLFTMGDDAHSNFAPRGLAYAPNGKLLRASQETASQYEQESREYSNLKVPYDTPFRIEFRLQSVDGQEVSWQGNKIKYFTSVFEKRIESVNCADKVALKQALTRGSCPTAHPSGLNAVNLRYLSFVPKEEQRRIRMPCGTTQQNYRAALGPLAFENYVLHTESQSDCPLEQRQQLCPANCGADDVTASCKDICPVEDVELQHLGWQPQDIVCSEKSRVLESDIIRYRARDCLSLQPKSNELPPELACYKKLRFENVKEVGRYALYTQAIDSVSSPDELKQQLPAYSCASVQVERRIYDDQELSATDVDSLFRGVHYDLGCDWQNILHRDALNFRDKRYQLDEQAFFKPSHTLAGEIELPSKPLELCVNYRKAVKSSAPKEDLGVFKESAIPPICRSQPGVCEIKLLGMTEREPAKIEYDLEKAAQEFGQKEILSAFPAARFATENCNEPYCAKIELRQDQTNAQLIKARARLRIPLIILRPFGRESVEISYQNDKRLEMALVQ